MKYEGRIEIGLSGDVFVEGTSREDAKQKLKNLQKKIIDLVKAEIDVEYLDEDCLISYIYTDENWKPTPRLDDEMFSVYENGGDRDYYQEYFDGDETRIEDAIEASEEAERDWLAEIEVDEIYFKNGYAWINVRKDYCPGFYSDKASNGDLVDAMFATGEDLDELRIYVDMKTGALFYDYGMRRYELVEAEKEWNKDSWDYEYLNERKLGPKVYAHFMGQDAADEAFKHLNEGVATND